MDERCELHLTGDGCDCHAALCCSWNHHFLRAIGTRATCEQAQTIRILTSNLLLNLDSTTTSGYEVLNNRTTCRNRDNELQLSQFRYNTTFALPAYPHATRVWRRYKVGVKKCTIKGRRTHKRIRSVTADATTTRVKLVTATYLGR